MVVVEFRPMSEMPDPPELSRSNTIILRWLGLHTCFLNQHEQLRVWVNTLRCQHTKSINISKNKHKTPLTATLRITYSEAMNHERQLCKLARQRHNTCSQFISHISLFAASGELGLINPCFPLRMTGREVKLVWSCRIKHKNANHPCSRQVYV